MTPFLHLTPLDAAYPSRLRGLSRPPASLTVRGGSLEAPCAVAIVGSREASEPAIRFTRELASALVDAGAVVVSGGAFGVDAAAHQAALTAGGRTWAVAGTSCERCYPAEHAALFERIADGPGAMVWPFAPGAPSYRGSFLVRNRILVALTDAVVVVQAGVPSGALRAARCARILRKPLWVVSASPWEPGAFAGSRRLLDQGGARPLTQVETFLHALRLSSRGRPGERERPYSSEETAILTATSTSPMHLDEIARRAHLGAQAAAAALLTLALEAVVVEGPPGFFRQPNRSNH